MEFLKNLWLKIIACICYTQNQEIPNKEQQACAEPQEQKTELPKNDTKKPDEFLKFIEIVRSKITQATVIPEKQKSFIETLEKMDELSKKLDRLFPEYIKQEPDENSPDGDVRRMFNGTLSSKVQGQLFLGIEQANHLTIERAIDHGADVNGTINGLDPLQYAIRHGKDYIIEFLLENGAEIKPYHIELAQSYQEIYATNLDDKDLQFFCPNSHQKILYEIRQYGMIANLLKMEMNLRERERNTQTHVNAQAKAMPQGAAAAAASSATSAAAVEPRDVTRPATAPLSRPRVVTFPKGSAAAAAKSSAQNDDDDDE